MGGAGCGSRLKSSDPDKALRNLDSDVQARFLLLRSSKAEILYARYFLNIDLSPYQVFIVKLLRGVYKTEAQARQDIEDLGIQWVYDTGRVRFAADEKGILYPNNEIMLPGGFGKTTLLQLVLDMEAHDNPNCRNQLVFKNITEAHSMADAVRQDLQNSKAVELFGDPVPKDGTWSNERFNVAWRQWGDIRANFEFFSLGGDYVGKRCDKGYSDDCETDKTARTTDACESMIASFNNGPFTHPKPIWVKDKQGRVQIPKKLDWPDRLYWGWSNLGTIFHPRGLHARCENDPTFNTVVFDCFRDRRQTQSLDDRMMTSEELHAKRRSLGVLSFNKRYRNLAVDPAEMHFHEESLRGGDVIAESGERVHYDGCLDREYSYGEYADDWTLYMGFDPATGSKTRFAAFSAYVVVGVPPFDPQAEPECFLVDYLKIQTVYSRQLDYLLDGNPQLGIEGFMNKYTFRRITLEKNNHGMMAVGDDRVKPYITNGLIQPSYTGVQKLDPLVGVPAMAPMVENGKFHLPYKTGTDQERSETFIVDMVEFHPIRDKRDLVMALWLATIPIREARRQPQTWHSGKVYRSPFMRAGARNRP